jgi:predicted nucleic acid-binding protein
MDHLADTNWLSRLQSEIHHRRPGPALKLVNTGRVHVNPVSVGEYLSGGRVPIRLHVLGLVTRLPSLSYGEAEAAADLRYRRQKSGRTLGFPNALMAATAIRRRMQLLTADKDFSGIPGLRWSSYRD